MLLIGFATIFSFDVFEPGLSAWQMALAFFVHNLPGLVLAAALVISWKCGLVGGIAFNLAGLLLVVRLVAGVFTHQRVIPDLFAVIILGLPAFLIGTLFLVGWRKSKHPTSSPA